MRQSLMVDVRIGFQSLLQHRRRTLFLGGAIAAVTTFLILMTALSAGIRQTMIRAATTLMTGHVNVGGFYKVTAGMGVPVVTDYSKIVDLIRKNIPEAQYVNNRGRGWARLNSDTGGLQAGIGGIDIQNEPLFRKVVRPVAGNLDDLAKPGTILVFEEQAKKLGVKVGDAITISAPTTRGTNNTVDVRVAAIGKEMGLLSSFQVMVPEATLRALYQINDRSTGAIHLLLKDMNQVPEVVAKVRTLLEQNGYKVMDPDPHPFWQKFESVNRESWRGQKLDVSTWEDELSFLTWTLSAVRGLTIVVVFILLVIIVIGIMNTMWIAIRERTREIGTLRAIGMHRRRVLSMFLTEAFLLGLLGTVAGAVVALLVAAILNAAGIHVPQSIQLFLMSDKLWLLVGGGAVAQSVLAITVITTLAAFYPSLRAARLRPVTAMHHVG